MKPCVFIHTNHRQHIGAIVSQHSLKWNSRNSDKFDAKIIHARDHPFLREKDGQPYLHGGARRIWRYEDLQSFTPLRFMPPQLMGYRGRAVVIDPDVFAVGDIWDLLGREMRDKAIMCRLRSGSKGQEGRMASSVMLLDCAKLTHWDCERQFAEMFAFKRDYADWISLRLEPRQSIGPIEDEWNDFDRLTPTTKLLHNTKRQTQPWKTGLPVDFVPAHKKIKPLKPATWLRPLRRTGLLGQKDKLATYRSHPDPNQERYFFGLLGECLERGLIDEQTLRGEMRQNHVRHDALEVLERTPRLETQRISAA